MTNYSVMAITIDKKHQQRALLITLLFLAIATALLFLLKWELPSFEKPITHTSLEVEISLEDLPPAPNFGGGGGGGGNPVQASGAAGIAPSSPPAPGTGEENAEIEDNPLASAPEISKPATPNPITKKISTPPSDTKTTPKIIQNPAPPTRKAVLGKTTSGSNTGGGAADNYDRTGGAGNGSGTGNGNGSGGGSGTGSGGGNGTGRGTGSGPSKVSGSRNVINPKAMNAGENIAGRIRAEITVNPDGVGSFIRATGGSLMSNSQAIAIVKEWLRNNRFNKSGDTTTEVYDFNIKLGG